MIEYELVYTIRLIVDAEDEASAQHQAERMISEIAYDYTLDEILS